MLRPDVMLAAGVLGDNQVGWGCGWVAVGLGWWEGEGLWERLWEGLWEGSLTCVG